MKISLKKALILSKKNALFEFTCLLCNGRTRKIQYDIYGCERCNAEYGIDDCNNVLISTDSTTNQYVKVGHIATNVIAKLRMREYGKFSKKKNITII